MVFGFFSPDGLGWLVSKFRLGKDKDKSKEEAKLELMIYFCKLSGVVVSVFLPFYLGEKYISISISLYNTHIYQDITQYLIHRSTCLFIYTYITFLRCPSKLFFRP